MTPDSPIKRPHDRIYKAAGLGLSVSLLGGLISYGVARMLIGDDLHFAPYFKDGAFSGFLAGLVLGFLRSTKVAILLGTLFLMGFGGLYWLYIVALLGV